MNDILIVVDMQKDFVTGALGTPEAVAIVPKVEETIKRFIDNNATVIFTRDTHYDDYIRTQEGTKLPVPHCIKHSEGWEIIDELMPYTQDRPVIDKPSFGSRELGEMLCEINKSHGIASITFIGLCTDICVISNALLTKAFLPEVPIAVIADACAGVSPESHENALCSMACCQIDIIR